mmetsp:Transcript_8585/g.20097  ORF Transcript_8585/g.20097 Transcript_8585/m.20097 type:complete len:237 (+) Transcript_8585:535-1245(+)
MHRRHPQRPGESEALAMVLAQPQLLSTRKLRHGDAPQLAAFAAPRDVLQLALDDCRCRCFGRAEAEHGADCGALCVEVAKDWLSMQPSRRRLSKCAAHEQPHRLLIASGHVPRSDSSKAGCCLAWIKSCCSHGVTCTEVQQASTLHGTPGVSGVRLPRPKCITVDEIESGIVELRAEVQVDRALPSDGCHVGFACRRQIFAKRVCARIVDLEVVCVHEHVCHLGGVPQCTHTRAAH